MIEVAHPSLDPEEQEPAGKAEERRPMGCVGLLFNEAITDFHIAFTILVD
jgi:hypothetical protein